MLPEGHRDSYAVDGVTPEAAVRPPDRDAVAEVMKWAASHGVTVAPRGGGTQAELGNVPARLDAALDLRGCNRLLDFQPQDLTVTVEAGMTLETLQRELAQGGKSLSIEAPRAAESTIGGILASGFTGPRRAAYGLPRDWIIGIGVVGADGTQTKAGGRVVKNVTGYDLNKLYAGSLGTLGIIVETSFKLAPAPLFLRAVVASFEAQRGVGTIPEGQLSDGLPGPRKQALAAGQTLARQSHPPQGVLVVNAAAGKRMSTPLIREITAGRGRELWTVIAFVEGWNETLVFQRASAVLGLLGTAGASEVVQLSQQQGEGLLREASETGWETDPRPLLSMKLDLAPSKGPEVLQALSQSLAGDREPGMIADPSFGTVRLLWWDETAAGQTLDEGGPRQEELRTTISTVRNVAHSVGGTAVVERCPLAAKRGIDVWDSQVHGERELQIMRRLKDKFDPAGVLNPGRFLGGI